MKKLLFFVSVQLFFVSALFAQSEGMQSLPDEITINVGDVSFTMIKVEAGSFMMGCTGEQGNDCEDREKPCHNVTITQDYYIGKFEVTQELYEAVMGVNPSKSKGYDHPVEMVSWEDAQEFCTKLSRLTGRRFTLPTEAEWEYAARGGEKSLWSKYSGSDNVDDVAWHKGNSGIHTHPVGRLRPNELGIYDMSGNVYEWCQDWCGTYSNSNQTDPTGPYSGHARVGRGGCYLCGTWSSRITYRPRFTPGYRDSYVGFRVVLR
ncbi:MAG: SUMF1/EgtB/PvdO family nonheme iron enzyme [Bacteroidales bacterium]|nr:SUMF1/EgtB/PvdO family nonheme iron enzyme [Bacteroidales bacterium]